ncbi:MAG: hypothetical protein ABIF71_03355, partial [Planctomycetota bacterium]
SDGSGYHFYSLEMLLVDMVAISQLQLYQLLGAFQAFLCKKRACFGISIERAREARPLIGLIPGLLMQC